MPDLELKELDDWVQTEDMRGMTSAQRDVAIYRELKRQGQRIDRVYTDWFGDPVAGDRGYKSVVTANQAYIATQQSFMKVLKTITAFLGLTNAAAWVALFSVLYR